MFFGFAKLLCSCQCSILWNLFFGNWVSYMSLHIVVVFTPKPSCSKPLFDQTFGFTVKNWLPELVSISQIVQWLGRYREGVSTHRSDPSTKNTGRQVRVGRCIIREIKPHSALVLRAQVPQLSNLNMLTAGANPSPNGRQGLPFFGRTCSLLYKQCSCPIWPRDFKQQRSMVNSVLDSRNHPP